MTDQRRSLEVLALVARFRDGRVAPELRDATTHAAGARLGAYALEDEPDSPTVITDLLDRARLYLDVEGWSMHVVNTWCEDVGGRARMVRYPAPVRTLRAVPDGA